MNLHTLTPPISPDIADALNFWHSEWPSYTFEPTNDPNYPIRYRSSTTNGWSRVDRDAVRRAARSWRNERR
jgi:hypothetical protein